MLQITFGLLQVIILRIVSYSSSRLIIPKAKLNIPLKDRGFLEFSAQVIY